MTINQMMQVMQMMRNPQQVLQKLGIPQESMKSPDDAAKYLLNNGKVTQAQIDQARNMYGQYFNSNAQS